MSIKTGGANVHPAIKEIIHHWFAFFEGETVPAGKQLDIFEDDIQLVHAGQHMLARGKQQMLSWLKSVPPEVSSHFVEAIEAEVVHERTFKVSWQTPYQAKRDEGSLAGAIIRYHTLVTLDRNGRARFAFIQKTPVSSNPETIFRSSFSEHRAGALSCYIQASIQQGKSTLSSELFATGQCAEQVNDLLSAPGDKHCCLLRFSCGESPDLLLITEASQYRLSLAPRNGWYPLIEKIVRVE